ncbi:hypothetical protein FH972_022536 [Carpinus fangiana]|uniref:FHA domain-containing protein n=1 Tax=Carpinus fangiana TaxID=176857 RepID=A0A5N6KSV2_9ROSI|nr:hypothetical protein FH972_022536 [Carpinus fangiana]
MADKSAGYVRFKGYSDPDSSNAVRHFNLPAPGVPVLIGRASKRHPERGLPSGNNALYNSAVVSREHAHIYFDADKNVYIKDLDSMHGTYVHGQKLQAHTEMKLEPHDCIKIGSDINPVHGRGHSAVSFEVYYEISPTDGPLSAPGPNSGPVNSSSPLSAHSFDNDGIVEDMLSSSQSSLHNHPAHASMKLASTYSVPSESSYDSNDQSDSDWPRGQLLSQIPFDVVDDSESFSVSEAVGLWGSAAEDRDGDDHSDPEEYGQQQDVELPSEDSLQDYTSAPLFIPSSAELEMLADASMSESGSYSPAVDTAESAQPTTVLSQHKEHSPSKNSIGDVDSLFGDEACEVQIPQEHGDASDMLDRADSDSAGDVIQHNASTILRNTYDTAASRERLSIPNLLSVPSLPSESNLSAETGSLATDLCHHECDLEFRRLNAHTTSAMPIDKCLRPEGDLKRKFATHKAVTDADLEKCNFKDNSVATSISTMSVNEAVEPSRKKVRFDSEVTALHDQQLRRRRLDARRQDSYSHLSTASTFVLGTLFGGVAIIGGLLALPESFFY